MKKQDRFVPRDYRTDTDYQAFDAKFRRTTSVEYAVLLAHVMIEDQLVALLAARLGADTMTSVRGFDLISGLALAGSKPARLREVISWLNLARNEVGHKMTRRSFHTNVERFVRAVKGREGKVMKWPRKESEQIDQLRLAVRFAVVEIATITEFEERVRVLGVAAVKKP